MAPRTIGKCLCGVVAALLIGVVSPVCADQPAPLDTTNNSPLVTGKLNGKERDDDFHPRMRHKPRIIHNEDADGAVRERRPTAGHVKAETVKWFNDLFTTTPTDVVIYAGAYCDLVWLQHCPTGEKVYQRPGIDISVIAGGTPPDQQAIEKRNLEELWEQDTDVLEILVKQAAVHNKIVLAEMRMSDYHHGGVQASCYLCPKSVLDHPEWRIAPEVGLLSYSHSGVRDRYLVVLRDIATNYQVDGIVLNWYRWGKHFAVSGDQRGDAPTLTAWLVEIRNMLDEVAHQQGRRRLLLTHVVPASVDESLGVGCDVEAWIKQGLADIVMPMDFLLVDFNLPTEQFAKLAKDNNCLIYPVLTPYLGGNGGSNGPMVLENYRALAANFRAWGADGLGTFNMYQLALPWIQQTYPLLANAAADRDSLYQYVRATSGSHPITFERLSQRYTYTFRMADGREGERLQGMLRWRIYGPTSAQGDVFNFDLNGEPIAAEQITVRWQPNGEEVVRGSTAQGTRRERYESGLCFEVKLADCPNFCGSNELGVRWTRREESNMNPRQLSELEVLVDHKPPTNE